MILKDLDLDYLRYCKYEITAYTVFYVPYIEVYEQNPVRKESRDQPCEAGQPRKHNATKSKRSSQIPNAS